MADGVFTPAISVTSAVGGIAVAKASTAHDITAISIVGIQLTLRNVVNHPTVFFICPFFRTTIWNAPFGIRLLPRYYFP
jgi:K+ transporter